MHLTHNDDKKGKCRSHTVGTDFNDLDISCIFGYGETSEEAFKDFIDKFDSLLHRLLTFRKSIESNPIMIEVDSAGKPLSASKY